MAFQLRCGHAHATGEWRRQDSGIARSDTRETHAMLNLHVRYLKIGPELPF